MPSIEVVGRLAAGLRDSVGWLIGDDESPRRQEQQGVTGDDVVRALLGRRP